MKTYKYVLMGALLIGAAAPATAQNDNAKAVQDQVTALLKNKPADFDNQMKAIFKANKKDPAALVAIGQAFLNVKDLPNAEKYADAALAKDGKYAKAWLLKGDIEVSRDEGGKAAENYQQAKYFAPKDPEAYYRYAMVLRGRSPEEAVQNLEDLRVQRPDYPVDALAARIYYTSILYDKCLEYYDRITDKSKLTDEDITNYGMAAWLSGKRDKSIEMCEYGLTRNPRRAGWNRLCFYNYTDKKDTKDALKYADRLFNQSDSAHFIGEDYIYYGTALMQDSAYAKAIDAYKKAIDLTKDDKQLKIINKDLADAYMADGNYDEAVTYFEKTIDPSKPSMDDLDNLARMYTDIAAKKTKAEDNAGAAAAFKKADDAYAKMSELYTNYGNYANFMRAQINANLDPDNKEGLAKPYYEKVMNALEAKAELQNSEKTMLKQAYTYMMVYEYTKQNIAGAKGYADKLLVLDPENDIAKQVKALK